MHTHTHSDSQFKLICKSFSTTFTKLKQSLSTSTYVCYISESEEWHTHRNGSKNATTEMDAHAPKWNMSNQRSDQITSNGNNNNQTIRNLIELKYVMIIYSLISFVVKNHTHPKKYCNNKNCTNWRNWAEQRVIERMKCIPNCRIENLWFLRHKLNGR